jgi:hypothetical protein
MYPPGQQPAPKTCHLGVDVTGVDLTRLSMPTAKGGATEGYAYLSGVYEHGVLAVQVQNAPRYPTPTEPKWTDPPCPPPAEGWSLESGSNPSRLEAQITAFQQQHPDEIASTTLFHPTPTTAVMVLAVEHPDDVRNALSASPTALCVVQAKYNTAELASAQQLSEAQMRSPGSAGIFGIETRHDEAGQPSVVVSVVAITPALHDLASKYAPGLLQLSQWLEPIGTDGPLTTTPSSGPASFSQSTG